MNGRRPAVEPGARGVSKDTRVFGGVGCFAERASQKPVWGAKEHAARDDRTIRQGLGYHMERKRGAFKVKLGAAPNRFPFEHIVGFRGGNSAAVKLDKRTHLSKY
jgi:hypothetical protein